MPFHPEDEPLKHSLKGKLFEIILLPKLVEIFDTGDHCFNSCLYSALRDEGGIWEFNIQPAANLKFLS